MSIIPEELKDYKSDSVDSDGGEISANQIETAQLSAGVSAGATALPVYDSAGIVNGDVIVIDDGTNKEVKTVNGVVTATSIPVPALTNAFAKDVPLGTRQNLIPNITAQESNDGVTKYRKFFRKNTNGSDIWVSPRNYIPNQEENGALSMGYGIDHADDDDGAQGNMVLMSGADTIEVVSDGADTRDILVSGLKSSDGSFVTETLTLNGTTPVVSSNTFSRVVRAYVATTDATRTVTVREATSDDTIGTIGANKKISFLWMGKKITAGVVADAEGGDIPGGVTIDATNSILYADVDPAESIPTWIRYMAAAGSAASANSTSVVATKGETT